MKIIISSNTLEMKLRALKVEAIPDSNSFLKIIEEFLFDVSGQGAIRGKLHIDRALAELKKWKSSKAKTYAKRIICAVKKLKHYRNFFSLSSSTNSVATNKRILLKLMKKNPEEDPALELQWISNRFFNSKTSVYVYQTFSVNRQTI